MLIAKDDVFIIDFEGSLGRSLAERRRKVPRPEMSQALSARSITR